MGDVVALGGDVTVAGHVEGDVASMGGDVYLKSSARVDGDVVCMGGKLNEEPGASVGGQRVSGLGGRRARLHHRVGELLENAPGRASPAEVAHHFFVARHVAGPEPAAASKNRS